MSILGISLSGYLPSFRNNELKPLFGQPYLNTTGYDNKREELYCKTTKNVKINKIDRNLKLVVGIVENSSDSEGISKVLRISKLEFLKMIANNRSHLNQILKFLHENGDKLCLLCNIYIVDEEAMLDYKSTKNGIKPISKLLLGHHIILSIPLKSRIEQMSEVKQNVMSLMSKADNGHLPGYLMQESAILIDFNETIYRPAFEILNELHDRKFSDEVVSLLAELSENIFSGSSDSYYVCSGIATVLKLKKYIFLNEEKFLFTSKYKCGRKPFSWGERNQVAHDITSNIRKIYNMDFSVFPPPVLQNLYNLCKVYEQEYYYEVNESSVMPEVQQFLDTHLENAYNIVKALPFEKQQNGWIIEVNDKNANEIYSVYLSGIICILVTAKTKHWVTNLLNGSIVCLLSKEEKRTNCTEPVFIHHGKTEIFMGIVTPNQLNDKKFENVEIYLGFCSCNIKQEPKVWICAKCKVLLRCATENHVYCECGVFQEESLQKKCFKCFQKEDDDTPKACADLNEEKDKDDKSDLPYPSSDFKKQDLQRPKTLGPKQKTPPTTPTTPAPPMLKTQTPTTPISKTPTPTLTPTSQTHIKSAKKNLNILFIGQSGAGKSMLVNSIYNYLSYDFNGVSEAESVDCILPCQFQLQTPDFKKLVFKAGPEDENEFFNDNGQSVTQEPKIYKFKTETYNCKVIDTPGLGDTRGAKQDEHNLNLIRNIIIQIHELHALCFVMPSNISKLTANFEVHMRDLLSLFPKTALKNVFFFFTYSNSTFFSIGDTRNSLEEFIATFKTTNNAVIPFGMDNVCCVDSEAFMYFIATKQGHKYQNRDQESFRISWDKSKEAIEKFLTQIEDVEPIKSNDILMTYELEQIGMLLQKEENPKLAQLISVILTKISQISMTSKFISEKKTNIQTMGEFNKQGLFEALALCQDHVEDANLKQFIKKLITAYGDKSASEVPETSAPKFDLNKEFDQGERSVTKRGSNTSDTSVKQIENKKQSKAFAPLPAPKPQFKVATPENLKEIAEKIGNEWDKGGIKKTAMETVLNIQIAANKQFKDIDHQKVKSSLEILLMDLKGDLEADVTSFLAKYYQ